MEHLRINDDLRLERVNLSMAETIFNAIDRDRDYLKMWLPFVEFTHQVSDTERYLQRVNEETLNETNEIFSIWLKEEFAGLVGFNHIDHLNKKAEIGYWLAEKMQGKGIITVCIESLISYAFQKLKMNRLTIKVAVGNKKSAAIPRRLGFKSEGIERSGELHGQKFLDLQIYSFLKTDRM